MREEMRPVWITKDGCEFTDRGDAAKHERTLKLIDIVNEFNYRGADDDDICEGIIEHWDQILKAMNSEE